MTTRLRLFVLPPTALVLVLAACGGADSAATPAAQPAAAQPPAPTASAPPSTPPATDDAPFSAISSRGQRVDAPTGSAPTASGPASGPIIEAPGARFTLPEGWQREAPSSSMRLAQARIDGSAGPAQLTVFHFGAGGGGGPEANLQRWIDQMTPAAGTQPTRESFSYGNYRVSWVDVAGTLKAATMGMGNAEAQPNSRLLGAVVEGPGGPWFFKAIGPDATLAEARERFLALARSAEPNP